MGGIIFYESPEKKTLVELLVMYYSEYREHLLKGEQDSLWYGRGGILSQELINFLEMNENLCELEKKSKSILDELVHWFIEDFAFTKYSNIYVNINEPVRFSGIHAFEDLDDPKLKKIWNFIIKGRSLNNEPGNNKSIIYSFLSKDEQQYFLTSLNQHHKQYFSHLKGRVDRILQKTNPTQEELAEIYRLREIELVLQNLKNIRYKEEVVITWS